MSPNQKQLNQYLEYKYNFMYEVAFNILYKIKRNDLANELVNDVYLELNNKIDSFENLTDSMIEAIYIRTMDKQISWSDTKFKKQYIYPQDYLNIDIAIEIQNEGLIQEDILLETNILDEIEANELENEIANENKEKKNIIYTNLDKMTEDKKILFDLYVNQGYNTSGKLAKYVGISRSSAHALITNLKQQLINYPIQFKKIGYNEKISKKLNKLTYINQYDNDNTTNEIK